MKLIDVNPSIYINFNPKSKYQSIKIFLQKAMFQIGMKKFLCLKKICHGHGQNVSWTYVISDINGEEIVGTFYKKELQKNKSKRV